MVTLLGYNLRVAKYSISLLSICSAYYRIKWHLNELKGYSLIKYGHYLKFSLIMLIFYPIKYISKENFYKFIAPSVKFLSFSS